mmetsp:Transcript_14446/g.39611  ORF Transcript_14446/g.39611 Transcript_14446/m.39611 type:complete len:424 (+) Transcript_14446:1438-2709(+)
MYFWNTGLPDANVTLCMSSTEVSGLSRTMKATSNPRRDPISRICRLSASFSWNLPSAMIRQSCWSCSDPPRMFSRAAPSCESRYRSKLTIGVSAKVLSSENVNCDTSAGPPWSVNGAPRGCSVRTASCACALDPSPSPVPPPAAPKPTTPISPTSSRAIALASSTMDSSARCPHRFSAIDFESSMASTTWYFRWDGLDRLSQILSFLKSDAMYGMIFRMFRRLPVRKSPCSRDASVGSRISRSCSASSPESAPVSNSSLRQSSCALAACPAPDAVRSRYSARDAAAAARADSTSSAVSSCETSGGSLSSPSSREASSSILSATMVSSPRSARPPGTTSSSPASPLPSPSSSSSSAPASPPAPPALDFLSRGLGLDSSVLAPFFRAFAAPRSSAVLPLFGSSTSSSPSALPSPSPAWSASPSRP